MHPRILNKYNIALEDRPLLEELYYNFSWCREEIADPKCWTIDRQTFDDIADRFGHTYDYSRWMVRDIDVFRPTPFATRLFREERGYRAPVIGPDAIDSVSVKTGTVYVNIRYDREPVYSSEGVVESRRDIRVSHDVEVGNERLDLVALRAIQEALVKANDLLAAWDALAA